MLDDSETEERLAKGRLFDLSLVDEDIAEAYKEYGMLNYTPERPLLAQIARSLRQIVHALERFELQIKIDAAKES